jgi:hypothetical protein
MDQGAFPMSEWKIMAIASVAIVAIMLLSSCADPHQTEPVVRVVEKSVPIVEIRPVPEELLRKTVPIDQIPVFAAPGSPATTSCLTAEGEARLRVLMIDRESRLQAWEKWGILP